MLKKIYTANLYWNGEIRGSAVQSIWFWQNAALAHKKIGDSICSHDKAKDMGIGDFKRVK